MKQAVYTLKNGLRLELELHRARFGLTPEALFGLAARQNRERAFLFVSRVLGKHLPMPPARLLAAGRLLAAAMEGRSGPGPWAQVLMGEDEAPFPQLLKELEDSRFCLASGEDTLFVGFAETATGLGQAVAASFTGRAAYISSTRLEKPGQGFLAFDEAHSHAKNHRLYLEEGHPFLAGCRRVVLVDDEFTTGRTAMRLVEKLHQTLGVREFVLLSLLDNSDGQARRETEQRLGVRIRQVSLLQGRIAGCTPGEPVSPSLEDLRGRPGRRPEYLRPGAIFWDGRRLMTAEDFDRLTDACRRAAQALESPGEAPALFLGVGEFIYPPALVAGLAGARCCHSVTQSPVYPLEGSAIQSGVHFDPCDCYSPTAYLYNVPQGAYGSAVILAEEALCNEQGLCQLTEYLYSRGAGKVTVMLL